MAARAPATLLAAMVEPRPAPSMTIAGVGFPARHLARGRRGRVRIVHRLGAGRPEIVGRDAAPAQVGHHRGLSASDV